MFSDFDSEDLAKLGKLVGIGLFAIAFALPAVRATPNDYYGIFCAAITAEDSAVGVIHLGSTLEGTADDVISRLAIVASGLISPLVVVSFFFRSPSSRRAIAIAVLLLMAAPWIVFGLSNEQTGFGATGGIRPLIGHYLWMISGVLIFTPEFVNVYREIGATTSSEEQARSGDNSND